MTFESIYQKIRITLLSTLLLLLFPSIALTLPRMQVNTKTQFGTIGRIGTSNVHNPKQEVGAYYLQNTDIQHFERSIPNEVGGYKTVDAEMRSTAINWGTTQINSQTNSTTTTRTRGVNYDMDHSIGVRY